MISFPIENRIKEALREYLENFPPIPRQTARVIVTKAFRTRFEVDQVIEDVVRQGPAVILPWYQD